MMGGSSRDAALRAMGQNYASTIGREAAVAAEENQFNRLQLAAGAIGTAGELQYRQGMAGMTAQELDLRARGQDATYNLGRGELEAKQAMYAHGAEQQGLQFLQGLSQEIDNMQRDMAWHAQVLAYSNTGLTQVYMVRMLAHVPHVTARILNATVWMQA